MKTRILKVLLPLLVVVTAIYLIGPRPEPLELEPKINELRISIDEIEDYVNAHERSTENIRPNNEAIIHWADSSKQSTEYALVYLHGFSASRGEGDPVHLDFAKRYGLNAYLSRLYDHGLQEEEPLLDLTAEKLLESAKEAVAIGKTLGKKVIVMSCSTGSTLSLYLAAHNPEMIDAQICFSPNIDLYDQSSKMLDNPWGLQIARLIKGGDYHTWDAPNAALPYWTTSYRLEALVELRQLVDATMVKSTFEKVKQPTLTLYYYKSEDEQDNTVSVPAILNMHTALGTHPDLKVARPIPDGGYHVFVSKYYRNDLNDVQRVVYQFAENALHLEPIITSSKPRKKH